MLALNANVISLASNILIDALPIALPVLEDKLPVLSAAIAVVSDRALNPPAKSAPVTPLTLLKYHQAAILAAETPVNDVLLKLRKLNPKGLVAATSSEVASKLISLPTPSLNPVVPSLSLWFHNLRWAICPSYIPSNCESFSLAKAPISPVLTPSFLL